MFEELDEAVKRFNKMVTDIEEQRIWNEYKTIGKVGDGILLVHPDRKGIMADLFEALYEAKMERPMVIYSKLVDKDKFYFVTDRELIETIKENMRFNDEQTIHDPMQCPDVP